MGDTLLSYSVYGIVRNHPINSLIRAYDHDLFQNELLGQALIGENGSFEIKFSKDDFSGKLFHLEKNPDLYFSVYNEQGKCIHTTKVYKNVNIENFRVEVDLQAIKEEPATAKKVPVNTELLPLLSQKDLIDAFRLLINPTFPIENRPLIERIFPELLINGLDNFEYYDNLFRNILLDRHTPMIPMDVTSVFFPLPPDRVPHELFTFQTPHVSVTYDPMAPNDHSNHYIDIPSLNIPYTVTDNSNTIIIGEIKASPDSLNDIVHPTYVQKIGLAAEYAYTKYMQFGFRNPQTNPNERLIIISSPPQGNLMQQQENRNLGLTITAFEKPVVWVTSKLETDPSIFICMVHEIFHLIQFQYHPFNFNDRFGFRQLIVEGGACFAEDCFMDSSNNYIAFAEQEIFRRYRHPVPARYTYSFSEDNTTVAYGGGLFWKYMSRLYSQLPDTDLFYGMDVQKKLLESISNPQRSFRVNSLRYLHTSLSPYGTFDSFVWITRNSKKELISKHTSWGNYLMAQYLHSTISTSTPGYDQRFDFHEDNESFAGTTPPVILRDLKAGIESQLEILPDTTYTAEASLKPYEVKYHEILPLQRLSADDVRDTFYNRMLKIEFSATSTEDPDARPIIKIIVLQKNSFGLEVIHDILNSEDNHYTKYVSLNNFYKIILVVSSRELSLDYSTHFEVSDVPDLMITPWNCKPGKEYEINPANHAWNWLSPDIIVDNNDDLRDDGLVYSNLPGDEGNKLKIRIRNKGNRPHVNIRIELQIDVQKAGTLIDPDGWTLLVRQDIQAPEPGQEEWYTFPWKLPANDDTAQDWYVKAQIIFPNHLPENYDNKVAISHFSTVKPYTVTFPSRKTCKASLAGCGDLLFIPRDEFYTLKRKTFVSNPQKIFNFRAGDSFSEYMVLESEKKGPMKAWDGPDASNQEMEGYYFPPDPTALPPGVSAKNLVTVIQLLDGVAMGGLSYRISEETPKK